MNDNTEELTVSQEGEGVHIVEYDDTEAALKEMREALDEKNIPDKDDDEGYELIADNVRGGKALIATVEAKRKELREPWAKHGQAIQDEAARIKEEVQEAIYPWIKAKKEIDAVEDERKRIKREAKAKRVEHIQDRLTAIKDIPVDATGKKAFGINEFVEKLINCDVEDGSFEEFTDEAVMEKQIALERLSKMYSDANAFEQEQAKAAKDREKFEAEKAEFETKKKEADEEREEKENKERLEREATQREQEITNDIALMKEFIVEILECRKSSEMFRVIARFKAIELSEATFSDQLQTATQEHGIILGKLRGIFDNKVKDEEAQKKVEEENKRLRDAEQKRIDDENERQQKKFEAKQEEDRLNQEKADREADKERNHELREETICHILHEYRKCTEQEIRELICFLEKGETPNISVQWKVIS